MNLLLFSEQTPLSIDEAIVVDSSPKEVLELLEEKIGASIEAYDLKLQIDSSMASKFGQRPVTNSHVRKLLFTTSIYLETNKIGNLIPMPNTPILFFFSDQNSNI